MVNCCNHNNSRIYNGVEEMKYLLIIFMLLFTGCSDRLQTVFEMAKKDCVTMRGVKINNVNIGDYVLCTEKKFDEVCI